MRGQLASLPHLVLFCFCYLSATSEKMVAETRRERMSEVAPFAVMLIMEGCTIALTILAKTALTAGISPFVFVVYTNAVGSILLLPFSFLYHRGERCVCVSLSRTYAYALFSINPLLHPCFFLINCRIEQSLFTFPLLFRIFFMGLTGYFSLLF